MTSISEHPPPAQKMQIFRFWARGALSRKSEFESNAFLGPLDLSFVWLSANKEHYSELVDCEGPGGYIQCNKLFVCHGCRHLLNPEIFTSKLFLDIYQIFRVLTLVRLGLSPWSLIHCAPEHPLYGASSRLPLLLWRPSINDVLYINDILKFNVFF